ncbi:MAG: sugar ABC transporter ATP-binding protein [Spartobacteria bacterium]|nr:sugar ABC transporter ATP-binding protein [Spartobacteria bacterium]
MADDAIVQMKGVVKTFGGVHALKNVNLSIERGSIHALVGENGAGKSTLMKILSGVYQKDAGDVLINNKVVHISNPKQASHYGIGIIHQEFALAPDMSVAENIFMDDLKQGHLFINWKQLNSRTADILSQFKLNISPTCQVGKLSVAYQQIIEITKALAKKAKILILDEPTAVLAGPEIDILFNNLFRLRDEGVTIIYISHRLEEIFRIADKITVLKDGQTICDMDPGKITQDDIIQAMVGRKLAALFPKVNPPTDEEVLKVSHLSRYGVLRDISLTLHKGEILGLAGLVGSGRTELARCIFGIDHYDRGDIERNGEKIRITSPMDAIRHHLSMVPESRKEQGAVLPMSIAANMTMASRSKVTWPGGIIKHGKERQSAAELGQQLHLKMGSVNHPVDSLSGGNQQKVVVAKWLHTEGDVIILDEPTRGVDVGAKAEIYQIIADLAHKGYALLVISSEMTELIGLSHRIMVMSDGHIAGELSGSEISEERIMRLAIPSRTA